MEQVDWVLAMQVLALASKAAAILLMIWLVVEPGREEELDLWPDNREDPDRQQDRQQDRQP